MTSPLHTLTPRNALTLTATELLARWEALHLGDPPTPLHLRRPGVTLEHQRATDPYVRAALSRLSEIGLADRTGPNDRLAGMLRTVAHAACHLDLRRANPNGTHDTVIALAAIAPPDATILVTTTDAATPFRLWTADSSKAAGDLLQLLGDIHPGPGRSVTIPTAVFDDALHAVAEPSMWALADELRARGIPSTETSALAHMCNHASSGAQLGATARRRHRDHRGPWVIGIHRNPNGHYLQQRHAGTLTIAPADRPRLHREWNRLLHHLNSVQLH